MIKKKGIAPHLEEHFQGNSAYILLVRLSHTATPDCRGVWEM
jgi:hypothetical protein